MAERKKKMDLTAELMDAILTRELERLDVQLHDLTTQRRKTEQLALSLGLSRKLNLHVIATPLVSSDKPTVTEARRVLDAAIRRRKTHWTQTPAGKRRLAAQARRQHAAARAKPKRKLSPEHIAALQRGRRRALRAARAAANT